MWQTGGAGVYVFPEKVEFEFLSFEFFEPGSKRSMQKKASQRLCARGLSLLLDWEETPNASPV
jgi:hypothetical protein